MPSYLPPKKNTAYVLYVSLVSQANTKIMQVNPTLAGGDVKVAIDDGAPANLATLPVVDADFTKRVKVDLSAAEMNGDRITVIFTDASGAEWCDLTVDIATTARQIDDLAYPTTSGRSLDVTATGAAGVDWANVENPTTTVGLSGTTAGLIDGAITTAKFAANAINDAAVAADVTIASVTGAVGSVTGAVGSVTGNVGGNVVGSVASVTAGVTVTTNNDKTGYGLSAAAIQAIWDALTSALTTVGSIGKLLVDNINATISSRLASASYTAPPTAAANADAVWDETLADHLAAGSTGNALNAAGSAGDPWSTALPGAYGAGSAGKIIGDNVNATISSRATQVSVDDLPTNAELATSQAGADDTTLAAIAALNNLSSAQVNAEVLDVLTIDTFAEPSAVPSATSTLKDKLNWLFILARNKLTQTSTTQLVRNDADAATVGTATVSDDGTTAIRGEFS